MNRKLLLTALLSLSVLVAAGLNAQSPKNGTTLTGTVLGVDGKPMANAAVSCESSGGLSPHAVHTDAKGRFVITGLKQDSYDLRASANGANSDWHRNIPVRKGQTKNVTLRLLGSAAAETPATTPVKQQQTKPQ
ncbi:MAG TPA: carboxypeptidase-like regulatory domain-containing protein [Candidatus Acidoferrum sp.]|nr:carboxypeptidase-like regulatory domain-containing protein [Candidatus Acidoferrum sp.]